MEKKVELSELAKRAATIKINKNLNSKETSLLIDKKIEKAIEILSITGLPK